MRSERPPSLLITFGLFTRIRSRTCSERFFLRYCVRNQCYFFFSQENDPPHEFCFAIIHAKYQKINKVLHDHGLGLPPGFSSAPHLFLFSQNWINSPGHLYSALDMPIAPKGIKISLLCHCLSLNNHSHTLLLTSLILSWSLQRNEREMARCLARSCSVSQRHLRENGFLS